MKKFIVARAGKTIDGREITAAQIEAMAASYDPEIYTARIWLEHYRSLLADGAFKALGDVKSLSTGKDKTGTTVLLAELEPTAELKAINKDNQKVFSSIEMQPEFPETGGAYLVGLAVTDSPASLGTQRLNFTIASNDKKQLYGAYIESDIDFSEPEQQKDSLADKIKALFSKANASDKQSADKFSDIEKAITTVANEVATLTQQNANLQTDIAALQTENKGLQDKFTALDNTPSPNYPNRPSATGADEQPNY